MLLRLATAVVLFLGIAALSLLIPRSLPGEMAPADLTQHGSETICKKCPPAEQITAIGLKAQNGAWFVNVRFAAPPAGAKAAIHLDGLSGTLEVEQAGNDWHYSVPAGSSIAVPTYVAERRNLVVFRLPGTLRTSGLAVNAATGDRIPASGFAPPVYPAAIHFDTTDIVLIMLLLGTAVYGYRRGALVEVGDLSAIALSCAIAVVLAKPLAALISSETGYAQGAELIGAAVIVVICAAAGFLLVPRLTRALAPVVEHFNPTAFATVGSLLACARQLPVLSIVLVLATQFAVLDWATPNITSSLFGSALLNTSKSLFGGG
jgi:uncharacterized membrane protein required for colicin V production